MHVLAIGDDNQHVQRTVHARTEISKIWTFIGAVQSNGSPGYLEGLGHAPELHVCDVYNDLRCLHICNE